MPSSNEQLRRFLRREQWTDAILLLQNFPLPTATELFAELPDDQQQVLFRHLPVELAAKFLNPFPYYHKYILLHSRPANEIHQILDHMDPDERMQFLDELPEEAWRHLVEGTVEGAGEPPVKKKSAVVVVEKRPVVSEAEAEQPIIEAQTIEKYFVQSDGERVQVIAPLDLRIYPGCIVALLGASGCGKSTLLRILSGLAQPSSGKVLWNGRPLSEVVPNVAIVFQSFALFPWLSVLDNVEAPLLARGIEEPQRHTRASEAISTVGLQGFETAYPKELSGGMRQRVGFARALVVQPEVLFMDEPFSALDVLTAESLRGELLELWQNQKLDTKAIFIVTHNIEEAVTLADRIIVLGRNPAKIRADFRVALPHPRDHKSPDFLLYVDFVYKVMTKPDAEIAARDLKRLELKEPRQLLPHARPGGIAGLLEVVADAGGDEDLYHLAERLLMEVDDLLPILDGAVLLGYARLEEGDVKITPQGLSFAQADIGTRKLLFREAALNHILLFRQIMNALMAKADRSIPLELFRDILDEQFPDIEVERQLETALDWGRYSGMFTYDRETERLLLNPELVSAAELEPKQSSS
jgi:NitT/TauT family transport system ATP-binding protein